MKKLLTMLTIVLFSGALLSAGSIQITPLLGYGFSITHNGIALGDGGYSACYEFDQKLSGDITTYSNLYNPSGADLGFGLGILYLVSENLGIEIVGGYVMGGTHEVVDQSITTAPGTESMFISNQSSYIPIDLTFKISAGTEKLNPYLGFGPTIVVNGKTIAFIEYKGAVESDKEWEYTYKLGIGWNAALGVDYSISDKIVLSMGFALHSITLKLNKGTLTKYTIEGADEMGNLETNEKEIEFKEDAPTDSSATVDDPTTMLTVGMPFSSLAIKFSLTFSF